MLLKHVSFLNLGNTIGLMFIPLATFNRFLSFVNRTLMQSTCPKIKFFCCCSAHFYVNHYCENIDNVSSRANKFLRKWLKFVIERDVEFIRIGFSGLQYSIPVCLYESSTLERLDVVEMDNIQARGEEDEVLTSLVRMEERDDGVLCYRKTFDVCWNVLKTLCLTRVYVPEEFMAEILLGSPVLETLVLNKVRGVSKLNITSPSVTRLRLYNMSMQSESEAVTLDVVAPWVKELKVGGEFHCFDCNLVSVGSLKNAGLTLSYEHYVHVDMHDEDYMLVILIDKLLKPVCHVKELVIGADVLQALSLYKFTIEPSLKFECKDLALHSPICVHEVPGIVCLLESSPNLENLVVTLMPWECDTDAYYKYTKYVDKVFTSFDGVDYLSQQKKKFPCLKKVMIDCKNSDEDPSDEGQSSNSMCCEFELVAYIIKGSPILEKLVILSSNSNCFERRANTVPSCLRRIRLGRKQYNGN